MFCRWFCRSHVTSRWPRQVEKFDGATALLPSTTTQKANALTHSGDYNPFLIRYFVLYGRQAGRQAAVAGWLAGWVGQCDTTISKVFAVIMFVFCIFVFSSALISFSLPVACAAPITQWRKL